MELKYLICQLAAVCASFAVVDAKAVPEKNDVEPSKNVGKVKLPDWALQVGSANKMTDPKKFNGKDVAHDALEKEEGEVVKKTNLKRKTAEDLKTHRLARKQMKLDRTKRSGNELPIKKENERQDLKPAGTEKTQDFSIDSLLDEDSYRNGGKPGNSNNLRFIGEFEIKNGDKDEMFGFKIPLMDGNGNFWNNDESGDKSEK